MKFKILLLFGLICFSCTTKKSKESSPTAGEVNILVDSNLQNIMDQQKEVFERNYPYAKVNLIYLPAIDIVKKFLLDSNEIIILSRSLDSTEIKYLQSKTYVARHYELARSAVAFVTNKNNSDTAVTFESLRQLALIKGNSNGTFVIENASSGISQYLLKKFNETQFSSQVFAAENKDKIIEYLDQNTNAIACFDWSEISDSDDPRANNILSRVKLLAVSRPVDSTQFGFIYPYQYNLQDNLYPFCRDIYFISRSGKSDLGLGFASFIAGEIGQKIMLKAGLLPKYQSERLIELKNKDFKVIK
ncbi:MAG: substrate-binding domain-containing protein [Saprospiraceae bacterium]|nr:substrate-binding domain-containing protein [Saprospiraceae bacterium]